MPSKKEIEEVQEIIDEAVDRLSEHELPDDLAYELEIVKISKQKARHEVLSLRIWRCSDCCAIGLTEDEPTKPLCTLKCEIPNSWTIKELKRESDGHQEQNPQLTGGIR